MAILDVEGLRFKYTDIDLFNNVSFRINPKEHLVLVGDNGTGKSTFMNLIAKNLIPDAGKITWLNNISYGYLDQHLKVKTDVTINEYLTESFAPLLAKEKKMNEYYEMLCTCPEYEYDKYLSFAQSIQEELEKLGFYQMNSTLGNMINGLGLNEYDLDTKLNTLSGGTRAKVYLAKLLLDAPDVILMDEPTNFLDIAHIEWLTKYLNSFEKAFLVISHDENFIRNIARGVWCLDNKNLVHYNMGYDLYLKERMIRDDNYRKAYENQQKFIKNTEQFIQKNIVRASTTKQAQSRRKMLERLERLEKPKNHEPMHLTFPFSKELGQEVLKLKNLTIGYSNKVVLEDLEFLLKHNQKIAVIGRNGIGKSTLLKTIVGVLEPLAGEYKWNPSADLNYFAQEETYASNVNAINYLRYYYHSKTDGELRSVLATAGIKGDMATRPMSELSGGQQTKVRLALMTMKKSNVLIFDEPTNHLDIQSKMELFESIEKFPGSVIMVSHEDDFYSELIDFELRFE
jgi:ATPase subunit of ABC transporter with duplicated ATPase domains